MLSKKVTNPLHNKRILGIDPGSRITGFGIIELQGTKKIYIDSGCIKTGNGEFSDRLKVIFHSLNKILMRYHPDVLSIEQVFMGRNADSALKLGQARGVAIAAAISNDVPIVEYSARKIKQTIVGKGSAEKRQVQHMVMILLKLDGIPQVDAADALAAALCHAHCA